MRELIIDLLDLCVTVSVTWYGLVLDVHDDYIEIRGWSISYWYLFSI